MRLLIRLYAFIQPTFWINMVDIGVLDKLTYHIPMQDQRLPLKQET